ncbi:MAG: hypothetical protein WBJ19_00805 [Rhodoferax sp.]
MKVHVRPMRRQGRNLPNVEMMALPPIVGILTVNEQRDIELGRNTVRARLLDDKSGNDVLPELTSALLLWANKNRMRLTGLERVDKADYAQTWSIELV